MLDFKLFIAAAALVCVSARHIVFEDESNYYVLPLEANEDHMADELVPERNGRMRRQVQGGVTVNSDGTSGVGLKVPLEKNDKNALSAVGSVDFNNQLKVAQSTAGLALENVNGHSLTLTKSHVPGADKLAAVAKVNLFQNKNHNLDAKAFVQRTVPEANFPNFNSYGGGAEYMYKNKLGGEVNMVHTPRFDQTDYSAMGKLNLFRGKDSSLDFGAGFSKTITPSFSTSLQPTTKFSFTKWF